MERSIKIFYHVYLINDYKTLIQQQLLHVFGSGLYKACKQLYIGVSSPDPSNTQWLLDLVQRYTKINCVVFNTNNQEKDTLSIIPKVIEPEDYILYFHTKGVSNYTYNVGTWRSCIEYLTVLGWQNCVKLLDEGYDSVGALYRSEMDYNYNGGYKHYSGGYWWSKYNNIMNLDMSYLHPNHHCGRFGAEVWIGTNAESRNYNLFNFLSDPYSTEYKLNQYIDE